MNVLTCILVFVLLGILTSNTVSGYAYYGSRTQDQDVDSNIRSLRDADKAALTDKRWRRQTGWWWCLKCDGSKIKEEIYKCLYLKDCSYFDNLPIPSE